MPKMPEKSRHHSYHVQLIFFDSKHVILVQAMSRTTRHLKNICGVASLQAKTSFVVFGKILFIYSKTVFIY